MATPFKPRPGGFVKKTNNAPDNNGSRAQAGKKKDEGPRINEEIRSPQVRVVGDNVPEQKVYPLQEALRMAADMELDLVEISPNAEPPVCKIIDYQKYLYQQKKKAKEM
ncbi:MAG: translation initiation factor IF-3, partial [Bacteroidales bacterium]|nr:translation initiation factor IF-3 [Bacteroidales bacterium]